MADPRELGQNAQDLVQQMSLSAPPEVRVIIFLFNKEGGPVAMSANVPKERIRAVCKDYLKQSGSDDQLSRIIVPGEPN